MKWLATGILAAVVVAMMVEATWAAPAADIRKPPVTSKIGFNTQTGPTGVDPGAAEGQWFKDRELEVYHVRSHEFYDNKLGFGGSNMSTLAIEGYAENIVFNTQTGAITSFDIRATITNDLPGEPELAALGENAHGEQVCDQDPQWLTERFVMEHVKLTVEFAIDAAEQAALLPSGGPYYAPETIIRSMNHEQLAWYCWADVWEQDPAGDFQVPTFEFGNIAPGESATRVLQFTVDGDGLEVGSDAYNVLVESEGQETDILFNRTTSLKVSQWVDKLATDTGDAYPLGALNSSDVSVFFNPAVVPEPGTLAMLILSGICILRWRCRR